MPPTPPELDFLLIGAGISGIGVACHLARGCPDKRFVILEQRERLGGTWDLFRYPGIRCDSDMCSFGYAFHPWPSDAIITGGESIREYLRETAEAYGVDRFAEACTDVIPTAYLWLAGSNGSMLLTTHIVVGHGINGSHPFISFPGDRLFDAFQ